jgi:hypothetical protein
MTTVKRIHRPNRLEKLLLEPGGVTVGQALRKAAENLESIRESSLTALDERLSQIEALRRAAGRRASSEVKEAIYLLANDVHSIAGVFGLHHLGEAAFSLCELIDRQRERGRWSPEAVDVHLAAFHIFRRPDHDADGEAVLAGLRQITDREKHAHEDGAG